MSAADLRAWVACNGPVPVGEPRRTGPVDFRPRPYIVVYEGTVVERIDAATADEAQSKQTQPGDLFVKVGD